MTDETNTILSWWGNFKLDHDQCRQWQIGPLSLLIRHLNGEWQVAYERLDNSDDQTASVEINNTSQSPETLENNSRYIFRKTKGLLTITPLLADRPVIARPHISFNLTAGEETVLYVSTPLWLELAIGSSPMKVLESIAIQRPSDTWFGPSTLEGELCYATKTHCRLNLADISHRPHRAITPVLVRNQADTTLAIERLNLPAPLLPVFSAANGQLWTPKITLTRERDGDMAELQIDKKPPKEAKQASLLSNPRSNSDSTILIRAFNTVFS